ncbi:RND transporter [Burkholderia singularis]|nr:RND transporter [Burkholderia sp. Bp7605]
MLRNNRRAAPTPFERPRRGVPAIALGLTLAAALAGCMSLAPAYRRPATPVPDTFARTSCEAGPPLRAAERDSAAATAKPPGAADPGNCDAHLGWRDYFADADLRAVIEQALANNRDLRIAAQRVEAARADYGIRRADQWPSLDATATALRTRVPGGFVSPDASVKGLYNVGLAELGWEADFWGRVRSLKAAALENFLASEAAQRAVTLSLIADVANAYLALRALDERIALARATLDTRRDALRIFRRRYEEGAISRLDMKQSEILLHQAETLAAQLDQARDAQQHALALLLGAPSSPAHAPARLDDDAVQARLAPGLPSDLLVHRPDVIAAEHRLRAANADIGAARAAFFPRITLTSTLGTVSPALGDLFAAGSATWSFVPRITLPIFEGGRLHANLDLAHARRNEAVAQYEKTVQSAFRDVADALSARAWLTEQVAIQRDTLTAQSERARLAKLRYDNGAAPFLEVLDAQRDLLNAQQQLVQMRQGLLSSRIALYAALGGDAEDSEPSLTPTRTRP